MKDLTTEGREFLLNLADWFERNDGASIILRDVGDTAQALRNIAAAGDLEDELERWWRETAGKEAA